MPTGGDVAVAVRGRLAGRTGEMADLLGEFVRIESGSDDPVGLAAMCRLLVERFGEFGDIARHPADPAGSPGVDHLVLTVPGVEPSAPVVVLGHYDTVWPRGTLERLPFAVSGDGVVTGPGCFDMKGGLVLLHFALAELAACGVAPRRPVRVLFNCDEEVGSRTSRELIRDTASGAVAAFVLEAPLPGGVLKTARKGTALYRLRIVGKAAHAGIEPERGVSANLELAHQVQALHALNDPERGTSVNVGVVRGGSRVNVVAAEAEALVEARARTRAEAERVREAIIGLRPVTPGARVAVLADLSRPPLERTAASGRLFARAKEIMARMGGPELGEGATGGGSDGNLVAAMGIPVLDGFGPEGGGAHADDEHVLLDSMPRRAALLAGLLAS
jgi:glutamate carboxypeptidase